MNHFLTKFHQKNSFVIRNKIGFQLIKKRKKKSTCKAGSFDVICKWLHCWNTHQYEIPQQIETFPHFRRTISHSHHFWMLHIFLPSHKKMPQLECTHFLISISHFIQSFLSYFHWLEWIIWNDSFEWCSFFQWSPVFNREILNMEKVNFYWLIR